jgi:hypothetical protein
MIVDAIAGNELGAHSGNNGAKRVFCKEVVSYKDGCARSHQGCERSRLGPFEGLAISSPRLCRG